VIKFSLLSLNTAAHGCRGGWMNGAFRCVSDIGGIVESNYYSLKRSVSSYSQLLN